MAKPKADEARCDLVGCGMPATRSTDGTEADSQKSGRKAIPFINTCEHHENFPFSTDAQRFAVTDIYLKRAAAAVTAKGA